VHPRERIVCAMKRIGRITLLLAAATGGLLGLGACSKESKPDLTVTLKEFSVSSSADQVTAGKVKIKVVDGGDATHEFVAFKTDLAVDQLPLTTKGDRINEDGKGITHLDPEAEDVAPGKSKTITLDLAKGRYVFVCNLTDHYGQGMHAVVTAV
jgi:uncharacterized cupredoxin-like copper-binding protein